jgi:ABC-type bacteriocin/lantibiotic exporter with double-glycine peptidase domain
MILIGILSVIFFLSWQKVMETALKESTYKYQTAYWLEEVGRTLNSFKLVGSTRLPILKADKLIQKYVEFRTKHFSVLIFQYKVMIGFKVLIVTSLLLAGSFLLINDQISIGQFVAAEVIIILVVNSVEKLILSLDTVYDTLVAVEKLGHVMDLELEHHSPSDKVIQANSEGLKFSMENVVFHPQDSIHPILKGVSLTIQPGRKVVITGKSGSGKSAMMALFSGLYEEYEGKVAVNDLSLEYINLEKYRAMIGDILELQQLFHGTIHENIQVGRDVDPVQLDQILELVGLKDYIYQLPEGLEAMIQPEGKGLTKSLAQRILLARGFVGQLKGLIMENVLQSIDKEIKTKIIDYIMKGNWTLLIVSEEEEILSKADQVVLMDLGKVVFQGSYSEFKNFNK